MTLSVCISGARGRMGRVLTELVLASDDLTLGSALECPGHPELGRELAGGVRLTDDARQAIQAAEVLVDFSLPDAVIQHLQVAAETGRPVVTGTTGFSQGQLEEMRELSGRITVVWASNMSRGVFVLHQLVRQAARALPYDAEVFEIHHRNKVDSPSGTAISLAEALKQAGAVDESVYARTGRRGERQVGLSAARGGDVVGEHQVMFLGSGEQIILTHRATSREHFCRGALDAARFAGSTPPGLYTMADVFKTLF